MNALVTGASKGIGRGVVELCLAQGWNLVGISRSNPMIDNPNFKWVEFDLMQTERFSELDAQLPEQIDLLVNAAGIAYKVDMTSLMDLDFSKQFNINTKSPIFLIKQLHSKLKQGRVVLFTTYGSFRPEPGLGIYDASKLALRHLSQVASIELGLEIINVIPYLVDTPLIRTIMPDETDFSKYLSAEQVAKAVLSLYSNQDLDASRLYVITNTHLKTEVAINNIQLDVINVDNQNE